jgi:endonuclease YncB( thermonuclease family)
MAIRFWGITAPEWDARSGHDTTDAINDMVLGKQVRREPTGKKTYDRCVGLCYLDGMNIEEELVRIGLARGPPRFSRYRAVEQAAADQGATIRETMDP